MADPMRVTLSGAMPPDALNGLRPWHDAMLAEPKRLRVAVVMIDVSGDGSNYDRNERWPIVRLRQVEVIDDAGDLKMVSEAMARAMADRTGGQQLPFEPGDLVPPPEKRTRARKDAEVAEE